MDAINATTDPVSARGFLRHRSSSGFNGLGVSVSSGTVTGDWTVYAK